MAVGVVILLGPPGSGKGTQAKLLQAAERGWIHISTGDLFRAEIASESPLGREVKDVLKRGQLVSDQQTNKIFESQVLLILKTRNPKVLLLDGYPRNQAQSETLLKFIGSPEVGGQLAAPLLVEFEIPEQTVVDRLSNRLVNPKTGRIYHRISNPPKKAGICDDDGSPLIQRDDDKPETIRGRYKIYADSRTAIIEGLGGQGKIDERINAEQDTEHVQNELFLSLRSKLKNK
jgi:adenylate kinase